MCKLTVSKITSESLKNYLNRRYSTIKTDLGNIKLSFTVKENETIFYPYDYCINVYFNEEDVFDILRSNRYTHDEKIKFRDLLKMRQKSIAKALIKLMPIRIYMVVTLIHIINIQIFMKDLRLIHIIRGLITR